jgi:hypothetical protein
MRVRLRGLLWLATGALWLATGAWGDSGELVVAPAGVCAGEERELAPPPTAKPPAQESSSALPPPATMPPTLHLSPTQVASAAPAAAIEPPTPPSFAGPGACDRPGSGCMLEKVLDDPDPGTGCGMPGSPCP